MIAGGTSGEDLKGPEAVNVEDREHGSWEFPWPLMASTDTICPLEDVRNKPRDCTAPVAWSRQAFAPEFDLHPKTVLFIMRYP